MQPILHVNLTAGEVHHLSIPDIWENMYLGEASLAARLLYDYLKEDLDPQSEQADLLFLNGPLSGTSGPAVGRFVVCGRSPATGLWGEANCGGIWGPELRKTGYDGLLFVGLFNTPAYLWVQDQKVELRSAAHLWGLDTYQTQPIIEGESSVGRMRFASIGNDGEAQLPFALIPCDYGRIARRTGMGAVMGSKNLKAVAVQGHGNIPVYDPTTYNQKRSVANRDLRKDSISGVMRELDTSAAAEYFDYLNEMPKRYFSFGMSEPELHISGAAMKDTILTGVTTCHACVIACGRVVKLEDGVRRKGPEYETLVGFGPNLGLNDVALLTRVNKLCDRYGMDTISMSNVIGLAFHLCESGALTDQDTGGLALNWGNSEVIEPLIHLTVRREGIGDYLALGARSFGDHFNAVNKAVQVNGHEIAYHDPRGSSCMALVYATSPRGACHNQSDYFLPDIGQVESSLGMEPAGRLESEGKALFVTIHQNWRTVLNSLVMCFFANNSPKTVLGLINSECGLDWNIPDILQAGERAWNLKRVINIRLGPHRRNDTLPELLLTPYCDIAHADQYIPDFETMLTEYYKARGWNPTTGYPERQKLVELSLDFVIKDLYS